MSLINFTYRVVVGRKRQQDQDRSTPRVFAGALIRAAVIVGTILPATAKSQGLSEFLAIQQSQDRASQMVPADTRLGGESIFGGDERLPKIVEGGRLALPEIRPVTTEITAIGNGSAPRSYTGNDGSYDRSLPEQVGERDAAWAWSQYPFAAANTFSHPLYFEDVMLERHGHERFPLLQPMVSGARFFATVPMLPYLTTVRPPCEFEYKMGHFRTGDCVYPYLQRPPYVRNAAVVEAAAIAGASIAIP